VSTRCRWKNLKKGRQETVQVSEMKGSWYCDQADDKNQRPLRKVESNPAAGVAWNINRFRSAFDQAGTDFLLPKTLLWRCVVFIAHAVAKALDRGAEIAAKILQPPGAEQHEDNRQYDQ
jgi:hypothetical protein